MRIIAANNSDSSIRLHSSAGGVFTILAEQMIAEGGVVYGAGFNENWQVNHNRATNSEELAKLRGSKYVFSSFNNSISNALTDLREERKVLYSGTPCQIASIRKRTGENENLLLVEVVCHGAPEAKLWESYLDALCERYKKKRSDIKSIDFRDKRTGWKGYSFTIMFNDGTAFSQRGSENLYMRAFLNDYTLRSGCFKCPFKYPSGSKADITLGDFWGIEKVAPKIDNNLGTTIVIGNTDLGIEAMSHLKAKADFSLSDITPYNPAICKSAIMPENYKQFHIEATDCGDILTLFRKYAGISRKDRMKGFLKRILQILRR